VDAGTAVETSKVFIREVAAIDPLWLTELAYARTALRRLLPLQRSGVGALTWQVA
jgi:hypothetical protein